MGQYVVVNVHTGIWFGPFPDREAAEQEKQRRDRRAQDLCSPEPDPFPNALSVQPAELWTDC